MNPDVRLVVFDIGGVLVRAARTFPEAYALAGLPPADWVEAGAFRDAHATIVSDFITGRITTEAYCALVADASGVCNSDVVERVLHAWSQREYPRVGEVFDLLEISSVQTALSNTNEAHWLRLANLLAGDPEYPTVLRAQHLFASHLLGDSKPARAAFDAVLHSTGVDCAHALFFDDVIEYVEAARSLGWFAERIDHLGDTASQLIGHLRRYGVIET